MRKAFRLIRLVIHLLYGFLVAAVFWPLLGPNWREAIEKRWARQLLGALQIRVVAQYESDAAQHTQHRPSLLYSNHVSWLDIFAFNSVEPVTFIAKAEISKWPIGGTLAKRTGTLFIERGKRHAVRDVIHAAVKVLERGRCVAVFPEGTTAAGDQPLHFHSNFVQPAIQAGVPVVPVTLQYFSERGEFSTEPAFLGEQTLLENIQVLLNSKAGYVVRLYFHNPIPTEGRNRHELSDQAFVSIEKQCALGASQGLPPDV